MTTSMTESLAELRERLDRTDDALLELLATRLRTCREIAERKRAANLPMMAQDRLDALTAKVREFATSHGIDSDFLAELFDLVTTETCRIEDEIISGAESNRGLAGRAVRIDHVAIAVRDLDAAIEMFSTRYGFAMLERRQVAGEFSGMDSATMRAGGVTFVLVQGDSPASNVSKYIEHYGPGVQHIAIAVRGQEDLLVDLTGRGANLLTGIIHAPGLDQSFTTREPNSGIQLEFVTRTDNAGFDDNNVRELFAAMERENVF
jgi:chorismate mutase-like protein